MNWKNLIPAVALWLPTAVLLAANPNPNPDSNSNLSAAEKIIPPPPLREFRAAWIATVANIDWPSKPGLSTAQQKAELISLLDRAAALKLNAVIFQVRPACDAFYQSKLEPWSEYLTGVQGRAPSPFYDPLAFAITEAHKRGLELHAWFNPFRAHYFQSISRPAPNHISRTQPQFVRRYGQYLWLDPGDPAVRAYCLRVVLDVVKRYDVDGIHFDDYFYPYKEKNAAGNEIDFPDDATWKKYGLNSGLSRDDWRRRNVDLFMESVYRAVKTEKPWVKVGISPFGIWRPKNPPAISGFDAYSELYADSRKWLREGWCDYFSPQLYWAIEPKAQSFPALFEWWNDENLHHRHLWPGLDSFKTGKSWPPSEIVNQIKITRQSADAGHIHWNMSVLMKNSALDAALERDVYRQPALIPASPWLDATPPAPPKLIVNAWQKTLHIQWQNAVGKPARWWVLQSRENGIWATQIFPADRLDCYLDDFKGDAISLRAADRLENLSAPTIWIPKKTSPMGTNDLK